MAKPRVSQTGGYATSRSTRLVHPRWALGGRKPTGKFPVLLDRGKIPDGQAFTLSVVIGPSTNVHFPGRISIGVAPPPPRPPPPWCGAHKGFFLLEMPHSWIFSHKHDKIQRSILWCSFCLWVDKQTYDGLINTMHVHGYIYVCTRAQS